MHTCKLTLLCVPCSGTGNYPLLTIRGCFHLESDAVVDISSDCHSNVPCKVQAGSIGKKHIKVPFSFVHMWQCW